MNLERLIVASMAVAFVAVAVPAASAQTARPDTALPDLNASIPIDPDVIIGTLPNGVRYYIRENHRPAQRAELRLVVNAGSVLEDSTQLGLAHLVEHMAFSGTSRFPKHELTDYLESTGMRFGADLNASTSFDETIYQITVPTDSVHLFETSLDILAEWAHNVSFDPAEIDRERKVVIEEWRLGRGAASRIRDRQFPVLYNDSRYAVRLPIGTLASLQQASRDEVVRFYRDWYRPDLLGVIAVGDFDKARVERMIRERFATIPPAAHPRPRLTYQVPDHDRPAAVVVADPEATSSRVSVSWLKPVRAEVTVADYRERLAEILVDGMFDARLREIVQRPDAPFLGARASGGRAVRSKDIYSLSAVVKDGGIERGLEAVLTESERVTQHGFTPTELDREKKDLLRGMEQAYAERSKTESGEFVDAYVDAYLEGDPIPSIAQDYQLTKALLPSITLDEVNRLARDRTGASAPVVLASAPAKAGIDLPEEKTLLGIVSASATQTVAAYTDSAADADLVPHRPTPGRIASSRFLPRVGVIEWRLSNGARVLLKPTDFKDDELLVRAYSAGGTSVAPDTLFVSASRAAQAVTVGGVGNLSARALEKALAGRSVGAAPFVGMYEEGLSGQASPADEETLFQLIYLYFTSPRADSAAFEAYRARVSAGVANRAANPNAAFADTLQVTLAQHHPRMRPPTPGVIDSVRLDQALSFYRQRFANAGDFTFIFVGNIDTAVVRPLVEQYLASLPSNGAREQARDVGIRYPVGVIQKEVRRGLEPKSATEVVFTGPFNYTRENVHLLTSLTDVLEIALRERLREALGGTYGVNVTAAPRRFPRPTYELRIEFGSAPERAAELGRAVFSEIDSLRRRGARPSDLEKVRETQLRERETSLRRNDVWLSLLYSYDANGWDPTLILDYPNQVRQLTPLAIRDAARLYLDDKRYVEVTLVPEAAGARN